MPFSTVVTRQRLSTMSMLTTKSRCCFSKLHLCIFHDLRRKRHGSAPTRAHHQYWKRLWLEKITAHSRKKRETYPSDHSGHVLNGGAQPSFQPSDCTQRPTKNRRTQKRPTQTQKRSEKSLQTAQSQIFFRKFQPVPHTPSFLLFSLTTALSSSVKTRPR